MLLNKSRERDGNRIALSPDLHPDGLPSPWWEHVGKVNVELGDAPLMGFSAVAILDAVERDGIFIGVPRDA